MVCERSVSECYGVNGDGSYDAGQYQLCLIGASYKKGSGYQVPALPCYGDTLSISNLAAVDLGNQTVRITWNQNVSGQIRVLNDGSNVQQGTYPAGSNYLEISNVAYGTHTICVEAV